MDADIFLSFGECVFACVNDATRVPYNQTDIFREYIIFITKKEPCWFGGGRRESDRAALVEVAGAGGGVVEAVTERQRHSKDDPASLGFDLTWNGGIEICMPGHRSLEHRGAGNDEC